MSPKKRPPNKHSKSLSQKPSTRKNNSGKNTRAKTKNSLTEAEIWGIHAVTAALKNPKRKILKLLLTPNAAQRIEESLNAPLPHYEEASPKDITKIVGQDPVHQGALLIASPLEDVSLTDLKGNDCIAILDQVTDPHNVGAILRSAAAFNVSSLIMTARNSPPLSGTLAKTACGGLENVNIILVSNLSQALQKVGDLGYMRIGFDGQGETTMEQEKRKEGEAVALILGAEEKGMRRLTKEHCDKICKINASGAFASLNVSNAAAIAFHHFQTSNS